MQHSSRTFKILKDFKTEQFWFKLVSCLQDWGIGGLGNWGIGGLRDWGIGGPCSTFLAPCRTFLAPRRTFLAPLHPFSAPWYPFLVPWRTFLAPWLGAYYNGPKFKYQPTSGTGWFSYKILTKNSKTPMVNLLKNLRPFRNYIF